MALTAEQIDDIVTATLPALNKGKFTQIAQDFTRYVVGRLLKQRKVGFQSGYQIQFRAITRDSGAARMVGLYEEIVPNVVNVLTYGSIPWRHTNTHWAWERRQALFCRDESEIVDLLTSQRFASLLSLAVLMEREFWNKPTDSTDTTEIFGIPYWIVKNAVDGFNGGNPTGFDAGAGGLSTTTYPNWKNYTFTYDSVSKVDLVRPWRMAFEKCGFESPVDITDLRMGRGNDYQFFTVLDTKQKIEELGEAQNENLGKDIASMDGQVVFRRCPILWAQQLEADTTNPIYGINWGYLRPVFLKGDFMTEQGPFTPSHQPNVREVHVDITWNVACYDRRRQMVAYEV